MTAPPPDIPEGLSTGRLVAQLSEQVSRLVRDEVALAKIELSEKGKRIGLGAGLFGAAGVLVFYGVGAAMVTAGLALALVLSGWLAALIVTGALFLLAGVLTLVGRMSLKRGLPPVPRSALDGVKRDITQLKGVRKKRGITS